ncbi:MAG: hypothetical protein HZB25_08250 [Candidatus Eisenbacteria bacterium]|nr:hypothetical protein [Candidatus Eisenbacteria bacterium]
MIPAPRFHPARAPLGAAGRGLRVAIVMLLAFPVMASAGAPRAGGPAFADPDGPRVPSRVVGGPGGRGGATPQIYELRQGEGGLHTIGSVWMHMDNTNYSPGNPWWPSGLNSDPGGQWPGNSGVEYILWSSLWVAGKDRDGVRRVSEFDEIRGEAGDFARTRHAYEGIPAGLRGQDDDVDGRTDEDFLNGRDDDGDGRIDEDYQAISPDMFAAEMLDYTPEALGDSYDEAHVPLYVKVRRTSFAWSTPGGSDFVGIHYDITNVTREVLGAGKDIDSVYVGTYWRPGTGARDNPSFTQDDLAGWMQVAADGRTQASALLDDPQWPERASREDSVLRIFWNADNDGDEGVVRGAGAMLLLGASRFPRLGFRSVLTPDDVARDEYGNAPRHMSVHSFRLFQSSLPYSQGGRPVTDLERYDAMANASKKRLEFPDLDNTGAYRALFSVGPYVTLPADSTLELDVAFCVGRADYGPRGRDLVPTTLEDLNIFQSKFGNQVPQGLLGSCQQAWRAWRGVLRPNANYRADTVPPRAGAHACNSPRDIRNPGDGGRETCIIAPPGRALSYSDCSDEEGNQRDVGDQHCTWFDLDCDPTTGACDIAGVPLVDRVSWIGQAPPVPPRVRLVPGDHRMTVLWDDQAERIPDPGTGLLDFRGYRLYRAAGWKRDPETGPNGPAMDLWELVGDWAKPVGRVASGTLDQVRDAAAVPDGPAGWDSSVTCPDFRGEPCHVHRVGYYRYVDPQVIDGFRYFYVVTAYDENTKPTGIRTSPLDTVEQQETGRAAIEENAVVARTDCATDARGVRVVPNPYRFRAAWDLRGSSNDPTGTHINFNHMPCGRFTLRIFTMAGDLVREYREDAARGGGTVEWNLVSRNGQDVKGGIYLYTVESAVGQAVGRFVVIR